VTSVIEITFLELGKLYMYMLPQILLFTIPIGFFIALSLTLFKLSKENESIVLFTLGFSPKRIALFFGFIAFIVSALLMVTALVFIPLSRQLNENFVDFKRSQAVINIKATEFGQRFSDWLVFIEGESIQDNEKQYNNIIMFSPAQEKKNEQLILSEQAILYNDGGQLQLSLHDGNAYELFTDSLHEVSFKTMIINTHQMGRVEKVESILDYWKPIQKNPKRAKNFSLYTLIALFPLATFLFSLSMGIVTYRYQRGGIYGMIFGILFAYFAAIMLVSKSIPILGIGIVFSLFFILSIGMFRNKIVRRF
jgi:lipopolysaccharide export system permease protein